MSKVFGELAFDSEAPAAARSSDPPSCEARPPKRPDTEIELGRCSLPIGHGGYHSALVTEERLDGLVIRMTFDWLEQQFDSHEQREADAPDAMVASLLHRNGQLELQPDDASAT